MRLNLNKFSFGVQAGKFMGFMLTRQGIEATLDNFQVIRDMRSQTLLKEVLRLGVRITILP